MAAGQWPGAEMEGSRGLGFARFGMGSTAIYSRGCLGLAPDGKDPGFNPRTFLTAETPYELRFGRNLEPRAPRNEPATSTTSALHSENICVTPNKITHSFHWRRMVLCRKVATVIG